MNETSAEKVKPVAGSKDAPPPCPLCSSDTVPLFADRAREYRRCRRCELVFVPAAFHLTPEEEKKRYDLHRNDPSDQGYRDFLSRLVDPLTELLEPGGKGLDYGCGPGPTVSVMLAESGYDVVDYDPIYAVDGEALARTYDFVTCTETVEHFCLPARDWDKLAALVRPGGVLAVMTEPVADPEGFGRWRYKDDPTHVAFYGKRTFAWIAERFALEIERTEGSVVFFRKRGRSGSVG